MDMHGIFLSVIPQFNGLTVNDPRADSTAGQPKRVTSGAVTPTVCGVVERWWSDGWYSDICPAAGNRFLASAFGTKSTAEPSGRSSSLWSAMNERSTALRKRLDRRIPRNNRKRAGRMAKSVARNVMSKHNSSFSFVSEKPAGGWKRPAHPGGWG